MKVSKLIHDLHEKVENLEKEKIDLRKNQDQDDLNRRLSSARIGNVIHERTIEDLKMENESYKRENVELKSKLKESSEFNVGNVNNNEKMKRLAYLEKHVAQHRYVFSEIPNTPENLKMVKMMKKHINKNRYNLRWRGQYLVDGENWKHYTDGQPLSKSKCIRVYIDSIANNVSSIEGFNSDEVDTIMDALNCWENELSVDHYKSDTVTQLLNYFESMRLHLDNSVTCQTKERVNIVTPN